MEQTVNLQQVTEAIRQLRDRSERVSCRNVRAIVGGSMTTVHRLLDEALSMERAMPTIEGATLSENLIRAIHFEIGNQVQAQTEARDLRIDDLTAREQEILADLEGSEARVSTLLVELAATKSLLSETCQSAEKASAVSAEQQTSLKAQLEKLAGENTNLILTGEAARTEAAKAQLQVERADIAAAKAENRVQELEIRISELNDSAKEAQKKAAVAECHAQDLSERISELVTQFTAQTEALQKSAAVADQIRQENTVALKAAADADKRAALAEQQAESRVRELETRAAQLTVSKEMAEKDLVAAEQLRQELIDARITVAALDKRATIAELKLTLGKSSAEIPDA